MEKCILVCLLIYEIFHKSGQTAVAKLALPLLDHPSAAMVSTLVAMV